MKTKAQVLSVKEEKFCQLIAAGRCKDQSDAYKKAFQPKRAKANTIHIESSKLRARPKIALRIRELMQPVIAEVQVSRRDWLKKMESYFYSDVRKMFDAFGNPIELPQLGDHEAGMIEGFEFCEDYTKVKKPDGSVDAVPTGYTKKYKLTSKLKAMLEFGKVMGWCEGDGTQNQDKPTVNLTINFVKTGAKVSPIVVNRPADKPSSTIPGVSFVKR